jgi:hypothetical protein
MGMFDRPEPTDLGNKSGAFNLDIEKFGGDIFLVTLTGNLTINLTFNQARTTTMLLLAKGAFTLTINTLENGTDLSQQPVAGYYRPYLIVNANSIASYIPTI